MFRAPNYPLYSPSASRWPVVGAAPEYNVVACCASPRAAACLAAVLELYAVLGPTSWQEVLARLRPVLQAQDAALAEHRLCAILEAEGYAESDLPLKASVDERHYSERRLLAEWSAGWQDQWDAMRVDGRTAAGLARAASDGSRLLRRLHGPINVRDVRW